MNAEKQFWDSNLWVYLFVPSDDPTDVSKQNKLLSRLENEPDMTVSVQVLNEVANVLMKKYKFDETRTEEILDSIDQSAAVIPMTKTLSSEALLLKKQYKFSWYDALIVAAAVFTECSVLFSEDMQHGLIIERKLTIQNPFLL